MNSAGIFPKFCTDSANTGCHFLKICRNFHRSSSIHHLGGCDANYKIINSDHNFFKIEDIKVDMNSIAGSIYKRRKREEILAKLEKRLNFGPSK